MTAYTAVPPTSPAIGIDEKLAGEKGAPEKEDMTVVFPAGDGERMVSILVEAETPDTPSGLGGIVTVE